MHPVASSKWHLSLFYSPAWKLMDQSLVSHKFTFDHDVRSDWSVDNIPLRFPNARFFDYHPIHIGNEAISIDIRRNAFNDFLHPPLDTLAEVLHKYKAHPLCITISWHAAAFSASRWTPPPWNGPVGPDIYPESIEPLKPYFSLLVNDIHRWKAFRIFSPLVNYLNDQFARIPCSGAPSLESLVIMDVEQYSEIIGLSGFLLSVGRCSRNFRELLLLDNRNRAMTNVAPDLFSLSIKEHFPFQPYDRLTSLRVDYKLSAIDAWCILVRSTRLVECVFSSLTGGTLPENIRPTTFGSLQYLKLSNYETDFANSKSTGTVRSLLQYLSAPNLKKLVLKCEGKWGVEAFAAFIARSSCALDSLHIIKMGINARQLVSCLELAGDSLTELLLEERDVETQPFSMPHFIRHLTYHDPPKHDLRACLCPKLKVISLGDQSFNGSGNFGKALCSRVGVTPLNEVRILCTDTARKGTNIRAKDLVKFEELAQKGVRVYLARDPCDGL